MSSLMIVPACGWPNTLLAARVRARARRPQRWFQTFPAASRRGFVLPRSPSKGADAARRPLLWSSTALTASGAEAGDGQPLTWQYLRDHAAWFGLAGAWLLLLRAAAAVLSLGGR